LRVGRNRTFLHQVSNLIVNHIKPYLLFEQDHYATHEILDEKHSMDFFTIAIHLDTTYQDFLDGTTHGYQMLWDVFEGMMEE
jgi:hypothetical protein